jgi:streptomycin 6-kinase
VPRRAGHELVLKLVPPWADREREAAALIAWHGRGAVAVRAVGRDAEALLLDRVLPGRALSAGDPDALELVADLAAGLHGVPVPAGHPFPSQAEAVGRYLAHERRMAHESGWDAGALLDRATALAEALCDGAPRAALLHGDLMDKNLLLAADRLVAIDPMPMVGDPHGDLGFWAATHPPAADVLSRARSLARRLGVDEARAAVWAMVYAVGESCDNEPRHRDALRRWLTDADRFAEVELAI